MENSELTEIPATETQIPTEFLTEVLPETMEQETLTTVCQTSQANNLDVDLINHCAYLVSGFILFCLFVFGCKLVYRLFNMFF